MKLTKLSNAIPIFGAGSVQDLKIKVVEGAGEIVLNSKRMMDVWLSDTVKDVTLRCAPQMRVNFSEKLAAAIELDSNALEEPGPKVFAQTIQNQSKNESGEVCGLIMKKEQREIPHVRRRFQLDLKEESVQTNAGPSKMFWEQAHFEHLEDTKQAEIKLVSDNFSARIQNWTFGSIRKYVDLEEHLASMMRDWSVNQDLNNQQPRSEDLGGKRHKLANDQVHRKKGAQFAIPGKYISDKDMQELKDGLASEVLPGKSKKLIE